MKTGAAKTIAWGALALAALLGASPGEARDANALYQSIAPLDQYLMARNAEIATGPECCSGIDFARCRGLGPRTAWLRNRGQRQERFRLRRGAIVDGPVRRPGVLESRSAASTLPQSAGGANPSATHFQSDRVGIGWTVQNSDVRQYQSRIRQEGTAAAGTRGDVLHDVEATILWPQGGHADPHLMFWVPKTDDTFWGAGVPGSPVYVHQYSPEPITEFIISVSKWSDGTPAPADTQ